MLGYFGKNGIVTPPPTAAPGVTPPSTPSTTGVPASTARAELVSQTPAPTAAPEESVPAAPMAPTENQEIEMKLAQLRAAVEAKRGDKEAEVRSVQEMQQKQAAYGRDVVQARPPRAGYATEAEKLMGGQTGYGAPAVVRPPAPVPTVAGLGLLASTTEQVSDLTTEITRLTNVVKQLTKDVELGVVPRSELAKAVKDLQAKSLEAKKLATQLSGWVDDSITVKAVKLGLLAAIGYGVYRFVIKPKLTSAKKRSKKRRRR